MSLVHRMATALALALGAIIAHPSADANIDFALANAGTQSPFSQLSGAIPTAWSLWKPAAVTGPAIGQPPSTWFSFPANLSEPGVGNPNSLTLGQIVSLGRPDGADRDVWGVFDRLSAIAIPVLLYFDNFSRPLQAPAPVDDRNGFLPIYWGQAPDIAGDSSGGSTPGGFFLDNLITVPEPAGALLLTPVAAALLLRRRSSSGSV